MSIDTHKLHVTGQTTKLQMVYNVAYEFRAYFIALGVSLTLIATIGASVLLHRSPTPQLQSVIIVATPSAVPMPTAPVSTPVAHTASNETRLSTAVVAYDAPNGNVLGPVDAQRSYTITARYGTDWLQADVENSGTVWLRSAELDTVMVAASLPDLQPVPTAEVVYMVQEVTQPDGIAIVANVLAPHAAETQPDAAQPTPIREKPTLVLTPEEAYWQFPTAVPMARTPGVEVSSNAYEACRRSGKAFGECKQHMPDDYFSLATGE